MHHRMLQALLLAGTLLACSAGPASEAATSAMPFTTTPVGTFDSPWAIAFLAPGEALVTQKTGALKLWRQGQRAVTVGGVPAVLAGGQGGLLDVVLSPRFGTDKTVYLTYSEPSALGGSSLALAAGRLLTDAGAPRLDAVKVLWRDPQGGRGGQFGAAIAFAPDGNSLFLSSGERQRFTPAQDSDQPLGKILHLTLDGKPAPGNPGAGRQSAAATIVTDPPNNSGAAKDAPGRRFPWPGQNLTAAETWSSGHRNPYGLAFDGGGRLWEVEMGPKGGDELNLIERGGNYGWPRASNGSNYDGSDIPDHRPGDGFIAPKLFWNPSVSPGALMIYRGGKFPQWRGDAFIAALSGEALIRVDLDGASARKADQWPMGNRIRSVQQGPGGEIYVLEDAPTGRLLRLDPTGR